MRASGMLRQGVKRTKLSKTQKGYINRLYEWCVKKNYSSTKGGPSYLIEGSLITQEDMDLLTKLKWAGYIEEEEKTSINHIVKLHNDEIKKNKSDSFDDLTYGM